MEYRKIGTQTFYVERMKMLIDYSNSEQITIVVKIIR